MGLRLRGNYFLGLVLVVSLVIPTESSVKQEASTYNQTTQKVSHNGNQAHSDYKHVWPKMEIGWKIVVGAVIGFLGAAFGSAGGVGGGGIFFPMLSMIIGFDPKSSISISKCMITGTSIATSYYNLNKRHPTLEMPMIDYDLALFFQPMLVLGVSIGVALNVIFSEWMITILLIIIFIFISTKAFLKGITAWKKETMKKQWGLSGANGEVVARTLPRSLSNNAQTEIKVPIKAKVSVIENVDRKALGLLFAVWFIILALQIAKHQTRTCSVPYWLLDFAQIPAAAAVTLYQAISLYKGQRVIGSKGEAGTEKWRVVKLILYCFVGLIAGVLGGMLGLGGGFILGPLFLEMGIPPQVSSATATFAMTFSASLSVAKYYLLKRFPVPYATYFFFVASIGAILGQYLVKKVIDILGRASIIIFILSFVIFISTISLGWGGIADMIKEIEDKEYMGFYNICSYA